MADTLTLRRMFADDAGACRFDESTIPLSLKEQAPPAAPFHVADFAPARSFTFFRLPAGWIGERHPVPFRCLVVCLSGSFRFVGSNGAVITMRPDDRILDEDTSGEGHVTEVISDVPAECLIVRLD